MNALPKYWAVKNDRYNPKCKAIIDYLNSTYNLSYIGLHNVYYGYDGNPFYELGIHGNLNSYKNLVTEVSIDYFIKVTEEDTYSTINDSYQIF